MMNRGIVHSALGSKTLRLSYVAIFIAVLALTTAPRAYTQGLELGAGWSHITGNFGLDGFVGSAGVWFTPRAAVVFNYDDVYDNSPITAFALSSLGGVSVKSRLQNFLIGPRISFPNAVKSHSKMIPFAEAMFGGSHLRTSFSRNIVGASSQSDSAFTWELGGGVDYTLTRNWAARANLDLERTHFGDAGQSRLRLTLGGSYIFGER
jgi:opacity protein-like surface antigen